MNSENLDPPTVVGFGKEWKHFDQSGLAEADAARLFAAYFAVFPWHELPRDAKGFDLGCGTGRWARFVAPRVGVLHCIDPSDAIEVARKNLVEHPNCVFHRCGVDRMPIPASSMDFGYSLGVLHHVPDPQSALTNCVRKLKPGAPLLLYLYYAFDNRPRWFRLLWKASDGIRRVVCHMPFFARLAVSQMLALILYWPLARFAQVAERLGANVANFPLSGYRHLGFYVMRTDALDRFGTRLEWRFTRAQIETMMKNAGLERIQFSEDAPYWCAVGTASGQSGPELAGSTSERPL
jgi:SAM-dependent methyltransferase